MWVTDPAGVGVALDGWLERELPVAFAGSPASSAGGIDLTVFRRPERLSGSLAPRVARVILVGGLAAASVGAAHEFGHPGLVAAPHPSPSAAISASSRSAGPSDRVGAGLPMEIGTFATGRGRGPVAVPPGHARVATFPGSSQAPPEAEPIHAVGRGPAASTKGDRDRDRHQWKPNYLHEFGET